MTAHPSAVGVVGLGLLGASIAKRLAEGGFRTLGYDIDPDKASSLAAHGITPATLRELSQHCVAVVIAVFDAAQVATVIQHFAQLAGTPERSPILLCSSTCAPDAMRELEQAAGKHGLRLLDFPISGSSHQVAAGQGLGLVAGEREHADKVSAIVQAICPEWLYMGACGQATSAKLAINLVLQLNRISLAEGLVFAESIGLDAPLMLKALRGSAAYSQVMDTKGEKMIRNDFSPQSHITLSIKDGSIIQEKAAELELTLPLSRAALTLAQETEQLLGAAVDPAAVIATLRSKRGKKGARPPADD